MDQTDSTLVVVALALALADVPTARGPVSRVSLVGLAIVLLAIVLMRQGGGRNV